MPLPEENHGLILLATAVMLFFGIAIITLVSIFKKKSELNRKEKEIMRETYEKTILQSQLEIQEQTFNFISSELHDNVGQILSLAKVQVNIMKETHEYNSDLLGNIKDNISKAMSDLRDIAHGLSSDRIGMMNICDGVSEEIERINKAGMMTAALSMTGKERLINREKKVILFRIIQECLQNCIKHACASMLEVAFNFEHSSVIVHIRDNGKGFDRAETQHSRTGLGMINMARRATLAGGHVIVDSSPDNGTMIEINIPYE